MCGCKRGIIAGRAEQINAMGATMYKNHNKEQDSNRKHISITNGVKNRVHLADIMRRIRGLRTVEKITRERN